MAAAFGAPAVSKSSAATSSLESSVDEEATSFADDSESPVRTNDRNSRLLEVRQQSARIERDDANDNGSMVTK